MQADMTIEQACEQWRRDQAPQLSASTNKGIKRDFHTLLYPRLGSRKVASVRAKDILDALKSIQQQVPSSAPRIAQRLVKIFNIAVIYEIRADNPAAVIVPFIRKPAERHFAHLTIAELPTFCDALRTHAEGAPAVLEAMWTILHSCLRRGEVIAGKWDEIDLKRQIWHIPGHRMKRKLAHDQPLSDELCERLHCWKQQCPKTKQQWLFPGQSPAGHISSHEPLYMIYKSGYGGQMTLHGIRHMFATAAHESGLFSIDSIELQLAHKISGIRGVYNHATMLAERQKVANWWSAQLNP